MPRRRVPAQKRARSPSHEGPQTRFELLTYAFSRLPPRQLPFLAVYAYLIVHASDRGWLSKEATGKGGAAIVGVLSMVTGLLLSYRFSSAIAKWDEGKAVWVEVRTAIRDGIRLLSVPSPDIHMTAASPSVSASTPVDLGEMSPVEGDVSRLNGNEDNATSSTHSTPTSKGKAKDGRDVATERVDELSGLLVGFAVALQHHLHGSRPLPQAPLSDLLPLAYLTSLKRTEARVRFADSHAGPSGSSSTLNLADPDPLSPDRLRPGLRRRSTGPPSEAELTLAGESGDEWELSNLRHKAEEAVEKLASAISLTGDDEPNAELRAQLSQLNLPVKTDRVEISGSSQKPKSNLHSPHPPNLPLTLVRLMEMYMLGLADVPEHKGGWSEAKRERGLGLVKDLTRILGQAERIASNPPPLPLTLHLSHLLIIYLGAIPCSLLCVVSGWSVVVITLIAGWCLLGLRALVGEVGGVFGGSENHQPLPRLTQQIIIESLDTSPQFMRYYRSRLVMRLGEGDDEVVELDRRCRRSGEEWVPSFG